MTRDDPKLGYISRHGTRFYQSARADGTGGHVKHILSETDCLMMRQVAQTRASHDKGETVKYAERLAEQKND